MYDSLNLTVKTYLWAPKANWWSVKLPITSDELQRLYSPQLLVSGDHGIYISTHAYDFQDEAWPVLQLDVEHPQHHDSITANIETAKQLYIRLGEVNLIGSMSAIVLTGRAFRFVWPFLIPSEYEKDFQLFIKDSEVWPGIDSSVHNGNNKFFRVLAYRGNRRQGQKTINVHTHVLNKPRDILELDAKIYKRLTKGKPDVEQFRFWLDKLLPQTKEFPQEWIKVLKCYRQARYLRSNIVKIPFYRLNKGDLKGIWQQVVDELENKGIEYKPFSFQGKTLFRLSECPICGETEGRPWLTLNGNLHCFRATCQANQGLKPSQWIENFIFDQNEDFFAATNDQHDNQTEIVSITEARRRIQKAVTR